MFIIANANVSGLVRSFRLTLYTEKKGKELRLAFRNGGAIYNRITRDGRMKLGEEFLNYLT